MRRLLVTLRYHQILILIVTKLDFSARDKLTLTGSVEDLEQTRLVVDDPLLSIAVLDGGVVRLNEGGHGELLARSKQTETRAEQGASGARARYAIGRD